MATHDYVIDNQSASAFRSDLNGALQAIVTQNSNATAPATTYANMIWYDTAANQLKKRNEANSAWITLGTVDEGAGTFTPSILATNTLPALTVEGVTILKSDLYVEYPSSSLISATTTLTAAQIASVLIQYNGGTAGTLTLPTATSLNTQFSTMPTGTAFDFSVISTNASATLAINTGVTNIGSLVVAANTSGRFRLGKFSGTNYVVWRL